MSRCLTAALGAALLFGSLTSCQAQEERRRVTSSIQSLENRLNRIDNLVRELESGGTRRDRAAQAERAAQARAEAAQLRELVAAKERRLEAALAVEVDVYVAVDVLELDRAAVAGAAARAGAGRRDRCRSAATLTARRGAAGARRDVLEPRLQRFVLRAQVLRLDAGLAQPIHEPARAGARRVVAAAAFLGCLLQRGRELLHLLQLVL